MSWLASRGSPKISRKSCRYFQSMLAQVVLSIQAHTYVSDSQPKYWESGISPHKYGLLDLHTNWEQLWSLQPLEGTNPHKVSSQYRSQHKYHQDKLNNKTITRNAVRPRAKGIERQWSRASIHTFVEVSISKVVVCGAFSRSWEAFVYGWGVIGIVSSWAG